MSDLDLGHVTSAGLYRIVSLYDPPAYVKAADASRISGHDALPAAAFARPTCRDFPIHTGPATWISAATALEKSAELGADFEAVMQNIDKAATFWHIAGDLAALRRKFAALAEDDLGKLDDDAFGLVETVDGHVERRLPLRNPAEVKTAADWLCRYRGEFRLGDRATVARKIAAVAERDGVDLGDAGDAVDRMAGYGTCATSDAVAMLRERAAFASPRHAKIATALRTVADEVAAGTLDLHDRTTRAKVACAVDECDRAAGLASAYERHGLVPPEDVLYAVTAKVAADWKGDRIEAPTGAIYDRDDLASIAATDLAGPMGDAFAESVRGGMRVDPTKLASVLAASPRWTSQLFDDAAASLGVYPVRKSASSSGLVALEALTAADDQPLSSSSSSASPA